MDYTNYILQFHIAAGVIFFVFSLWLLFLEIRFRRLFRGRKAKDVKSILASLDKDLKNLNIARKEVEKYLETVEKRLRKSIQHTGFLRFNPFDDAGSNQSFVVALLNELGDGVVISSLYSREKVGIYAKPIKNYQSEYQLTKEEEDAINKPAH